MRSTVNVPSQELVNEVEEVVNLVIGHESFSVQSWLLRGQTEYPRIVPLMEYRS